MIELVENSDIAISRRIRSIFQVSYKIEAELLQATDFPPLKRSSYDISKSKNDFYAYYLFNSMAGIIEVECNENNTHIQSLVVHPRHFRKGIASKLIGFVLDFYKSNKYSVETGVDNHPALKLYKGFDFKEIRQWDTDHDVRKVRLEKYIN